MRFASTLAFSVLLGVLLPSTQHVAAAEEGDFDQLDRVNELQQEARAAARAEDWVRARELAEVVLTLDDSVDTAESRLILVRALEQEDQFGAALYELRQFLELPLSSSLARRGERLRQRILRVEGANRAGMVDFRAGKPAVKRSGVAGAVGVLLGGITMTVTGTYFIGVDLHWKSQDVRSGTWAALGTSLLLGGLSLDITGIVLLRRARSADRQGTSSRGLQELPRVAVGWGHERVDFVLWGTW
jgi:hypothetical protein